jgi:preprotein translocase subunit Sec61beta
MRKYEGINSINFGITSFFCEYKMSRLKVKDQIICMISEEYNLL